MCPYQEQPQRKASEPACVVCAMHACARSISKIKFPGSGVRCALMLLLLLRANSPALDINLNSSLSCTRTTLKPAHASLNAIS
jgi:hypothetical protein